MLAKNCNWPRVGLGILIVLFVWMLYAQYSRQTGISRAFSGIMSNDGGLQEGLSNNPADNNTEDAKNLAKILNAQMENRLIDSSTISNIKEHYWKLNPNKINPQQKRPPEDNEMYGLYFEWTTSQDMTAYEEKETLNILTLNHQNGGYILKVYYKKRSGENGEIDLCVALFKPDDTYVHEHRITTLYGLTHSNLAAYTSNRLVLSRDAWGHYMLWIHATKDLVSDTDLYDAPIHIKFALKDKVESNYPLQSDFVKCDGIDCLVDSNGNPAPKTGFGALKLDHIQLGDDTFIFKKADIAFDKQYTSSLFYGTGEYIWQELYGDCEAGKRQATYYCLRAGDPNMKFSHLKEKMEDYIVEDSECNEDPSLTPPSVTNLPEMPCKVGTEEQCHPCEIINFVEDVKLQPATSDFWTKGMRKDDLQQFAKDWNAKQNPKRQFTLKCATCIETQINKVGGPIDMNSPLLNRTGLGKNSGQSLMFNCGGNFQNEMGTTSESQKKYLKKCKNGSYTPGDPITTSTSVDTTMSGKLSATQLEAINAFKEAIEDKSTTKGVLDTAESLIFGLAGEKKKIVQEALDSMKGKSNVNEMKEALNKFEQEASTPSTPAAFSSSPSTSSPSSVGDSLLTTMGQLMGGASSTSSWLPAWASTDDNKSKTIQVVDDNYNVFVDTGRRGRGYGSGRYATGGVWDDLYGMSSANSYECRGLNTQRNFDTMNRRCQNMWLNLYGKELEDCYEYVKEGHSWRTIPRRCKNLLSSYFSLSRDGYDNTRLSQLAMKDYETNEVTNYTYCNTFCNHNPCTKQCKRWNCSNCVGVDSVDASEITEAVNAAKDIWKDKKANHYSSMQRLWYMGDNGRTGRSYNHFSDNLKGVDDNDLAWNTYESAIPISELRAW